MVRTGTSHLLIQPTRESQNGFTMLSSTNFRTQPLKVAIKSRKMLSLPKKLEELRQTTPQRTRMFHEMRKLGGLLPRLRLQQLSSLPRDEKNPQNGLRRRDNGLRSPNKNSPTKKLGRKRLTKPTRPDNQQSAESDLLKEQHQAVQQNIKSKHKIA